MQQPFLAYSVAVNRTAVKDKRDARRIRWWRFAERAVGLYKATSQLDKFIVSSRISTHLGFTFLNSGYVVDIALNLFRDIFPAARCVLLICFLSTTNTPQLATGIFYCFCIF
jgi:hypothetical protein